MRGLGLLTAIVLVSSSLMPVTNTQYDTEAPVEVQEACTKWGEYYDICPELLQAICWNESRYETDLVNGTCVGIMQINEPVHTARIEKLGVTDIHRRKYPCWRRSSCGAVCRLPGCRDGTWPLSRREKSRVKRQNRQLFDIHKNNT